MKIQTENKIAFQWDAYHPLIDRILTCTVARGVYLPGGYLPGQCTCLGVYLPGGYLPRGVCVPAGGICLGVPAQGVYLSGDVPE